MATFEYEGRDIRVVPVHEMDLGDLAFIKREFGIDGTIALGTALANQEVDGWRGLLVNSVRRVDPGVSPDTAGLDHVRIQELTDALNGEYDEYVESKAAEEAKRTTRGGRTRPTKATRS